jgi:uncharacterized protein YndB with AHSA1/START domain
MPKLHYDFIVDKENNTLTVQREFQAGRQLVWDAWTKAELLDQWFAPPPFTTKTKSMDFRDGGHWIYVMITPDGTEYWSRSDYVQIQPIDFYSAWDGFCDENGVINQALPRAKWNTTFTDKGENTLVENVVTYDSLADLETVIKMGMKEGMESTLNRLDEFLAVCLAGK